MPSPIENSFGVVTRTRPLTESSLIVHWLTRDLGRLATVAKGARRPKSPFLGKLDLFYAADFSFSRSRRTELHTLREVSLKKTHSSLRTDLALFQQACYCAALIEQTTEMETPISGIFDLMSGLLTSLEVVSPQSQTVFAFELKLLQELGMQPHLEKTNLNPGTRNILKTLTEGDWPMVGRVRLSEGQGKELAHFLHGFLIFHLGRIPKGRAGTLTL